MTNFWEILVIEPLKITANDPHWENASIYQVGVAVKHVSIIHPINESTDFTQIE